MSTTSPKSPSFRSHQPEGSPFGFKQSDWSYVRKHKDATSKLYVVMGLKYASKRYNTKLLMQNVKARFAQAVSAHNDKHQSDRMKLVFSKLSAGFGEHLFNRIARSIIGADIAVFDTSDLNANVMIELGVALTWGKPGDASRFTSFGFRYRAQERLQKLRERSTLRSE